MWHPKGLENPGIQSSTPWFPDPPYGEGANIGGVLRPHDDWMLLLALSMGTRGGNLRGNGKASFEKELSREKKAQAIGSYWETPCGAGAGPTRWLLLPGVPTFACLGRGQDRWLSLPTERSSLDRRWTSLGGHSPGLKWRRCHIKRPALHSWSLVNINSGLD